MRIGIAVGVGSPAENSIEGLRARAAQVERAGLDHLWMGMAFGMDPMTALAVAGQATTTLELGTAVVPTLPRHPIVMAQQARTTQAALGGRFHLGIGLSHDTMMRDNFGLDPGRPVTHLTDYLDVLTPLLAGRSVVHAGPEYRVDVEIDIVSDSVPLLVAALGPAMLRVAGERTDGTITAWVGVRTLESHVVPAITAAAESAGRRSPRVVAIMPMAITGDPDGARRSLDETWAWYGSLPVFQAVFEREGVSGPGGMALVGDERTLDAALDRLQQAGVTDLVANLIGVDPGAAERTFDYLVARRHD